MEKNINYLIELDEFLMKILRDGYVLKRSKSKDPQQLFNIQMFNKLRDDGYIEPDNFEWDKYQISFDGTLFIENGGYCGKAKMDGLKQKNQNRKDWLLITGTWVIGLGTVGLVIAELYNNHLITAIDNSLHSNQDTRFCSIIYIMLSRILQINPRFRKSLLNIISVIEAPIKLIALRFI